MKLTMRGKIVVVLLAVIALALLEAIAEKYVNLDPATYVAEIKRGKVYDKVNTGSIGNMSGRYMVEVRTGVIYGIKAYGQVHKGHVYGTLDTVDEWYWGDYYARPREI